MDKTPGATDSLWVRHRRTAYEDGDPRNAITLFQNVSTFFLKPPGRGSEIATINGRVVPSKGFFVYLGLHAFGKVSLMHLPSLMELELQELWM